MSITWVVQNNVFNEHNYDKLIESLDRTQTKYELVKMIPFQGTLDRELTIDPNDTVFCYGSISLGNIAKQNNWVYLDNNLDLVTVSNHYKEHMLNSDFKIYPLSQVPEQINEFFIRPVKDDKLFGGFKTDWFNFSEWLSQKTHLVEQGGLKFDLNEFVVISSVKQLYSEYRFFIVDGKISTYSRYKLGGKLSLSSVVDPYIIDFVNETISVYCPEIAFVIDVALTGEGLKVIECNSINGSGLYECDPFKLVNSINSLYN